jgi:ATP adenylyltransferase
MAYIQKHKEEEGCVFCNAQGMPDGPDNLIVYRGQQAFVILNRFPYTSGHLMVVPYTHEASLEGLEPGERSEMMELTTRAMSLMSKEYDAQGFNIGVNIGEAAGAGIIEHVHLHVVPRWIGDTNFMSTLGNTRVLPESLEDTFLRLQKSWRMEYPE